MFLNELKNKKYLFIITLFMANFLVLFEKRVPILSYLFEQGFSYVNITSLLKNEKDRELFLKNKTDFYFKKRTNFLRKHHIIYNESNIITFQDKLNYLDIHESPEYKSFLVDKIRLHEYSRKLLGKDICVPILKIYDK